MGGRLDEEDNDDLQSDTTSTPGGGVASTASSRTPSRIEGSPSYSPPQKGSLGSSLLSTSPPLGQEQHGVEIVDIDDQRFSLEDDEEITKALSSPQKVRPSESQSPHKRSPRGSRRRVGRDDVRLPTPTDRI